MTDYTPEFYGMYDASNSQEMANDILGTVFESYDGGGESDFVKYVSDDPELFEQYEIAAEEIKMKISQAIEAAAKKITLLLNEFEGMEKGMIEKGRQKNG